jgi:hypothetical protein
MDAKLCFAAQGAAPRREVAEARQSLASKSVPKQELGDEINKTGFAMGFSQKEPRHPGKIRLLAPRALAPALWTGARLWYF